PYVKLSLHTAPDVQLSTNAVERLASSAELLPLPVGPGPWPDNAVPSVRPHYRIFNPVGSEEARSIALALASVRRSNWTCSFPASSFHETFRLILKEQMRTRVPLDWATTQDSLGVTLTRLGERESPRQG